MPRYMRPTVFMTPLLLALAASAAGAQSSCATPGEAKDEPKWGPAPAVFPAGAKLAVMAGDPHGSGEFTVRLCFPAGYRIMPHTHPTDEHITIIRGSFKVGMGEKFDSGTMLVLKPGGFVTAPANHAHYAEAQGVTIVQVHAIGPFSLAYVNPADTPRAAATR